ncbi:Cro protein [Gordonia phage Pytheas]|nr:immunity repressor [Gordonia Phage Jablanski]UYL88074.1 Cro protein [Gordonia phage Pytheas]
MARSEIEVGELYMILKDRKQLASVMIVQGISQRELAKAAGWKSHSYLGRLLRGEKRTLDGDAALRIAHRLGMPVDMLFLTVVSEKTGSEIRSSDTKRGVA